MIDCISRQAVLEKQYRIDDSATLSTRDVVDVEDIEDMPSVTPTDSVIEDILGKALEIIYEHSKETPTERSCNSCKHLSDTETEVCLECEYDGNTRGNTRYEPIERTGHWIDHDKHIECDKCKTWFLKDHLIRKSFCPNCGVRMFESQESEDKE